MLSFLSRHLKTWRRARQSVKALGALSDAELADIGLTRGDIAYVARKSAKAEYRVRR